MAKKLNIKKSMLMILVIFSGILLSCTPTVSAGLIDVEPVINVTYRTTDELAIPQNNALNITLITSISFNGIGANFVQNSPFSLLKDSSVTIELLLEEDYEWATARLTNTPAEIKISENESYWISTLQISVTEKAPAFTLGKIKIIANSSKVQGLLFDIGEKTAEVEIPFEVGYSSVVTYDLPEGNFREIAPYNTTKIPINITNLGNGATNLQIELVESPENFIIDLPTSITLDAFDGKEQIFLEITAGNHEFENKQIKINCTSNYLGSPILRGATTTLTFNVQNDGSYEEPSDEDGIKIDASIISIIVLAIIMIVAGIVAYTKYIKKQ